MSPTLSLALLAWCALQYCIHPVQSYPNGAPAVACRTLTPRHFSIPQGNSGSFALHVREIVNGSWMDVSHYMPNSTYQVTLTTQLHSNVFCKGFLVQTRLVPSGDLLNHVGAGFTEPAPGSKHKLSACSPPSSGVTHIDRDQKSKVQFDWVAPPASAGTIDFRFTCVQHYNFYYVNLQGPMLTPDPSASTDEILVKYTTEPPAETTTDSSGFRPTLFSWLTVILFSAVAVILV